MTSETTPLLQEQPHHETTTTVENENENETHSLSRRAIITILLLAVIILTIDLGAFIGAAATTDIFEDIICRQYYSSFNQGPPSFPSSDVSLWSSSSSPYFQRDGAGLDRRKYCKIEPVQSELAVVMGWMDTFSMIPNIALAIPFGSLADRIGRRPVLLLGLVGVMLAQGLIIAVCWLSPLLPLRTVWAAVLTQVIGGGAQTVMSTLFVIIADVCPVEKRATIFSQLGSIAFISELIGTPIGAALMSITPWLAFVLGYCVSFVGFLLAFFLPETLPAAKCVSAVSLLEESSDEDYQVGNSSASRRRSISLSAFLSVKLREGMEKLNYALVLVTENLNVGLILLSFFASCLGRQMTPLLLQYTSKRLNWSIAEAAYLLTLRAAINCLILLLILPLLSTHLTTTLKIHPITSDKTLTQSSALLFMTGCLMIFLAHTPALLVTGIAINAFGSAFQITARSLVTLLVKQEHLGTTYAGIAVVTAVGVLVSGPVLAAAFQWGLRLGEFWLGLPFLVAGGLYGLGFLAVSLVK